MQALTPAATSQDFVSHHAASPHPYMSGAPADPVVAPRPGADERHAAKAKPRALVVDDARVTRSGDAFALRRLRRGRCFCRPRLETAPLRAVRRVFSDIGMPA